MEAGAAPPPPPPDGGAFAGAQQGADPAAAGAPPAAPPAPPAEGGTGGSEPVAQAAQQGRAYVIEQELELDMSSAAAKKESTALLEKYIEDGKVTVHVVVGRATAKDNRAALIQLGQNRELDGDYDVVAAQVRTRFTNVRTAKRVDVSIG